MKAVVMERRHGGPEMLKMREVPTPTPKANEILFGYMPRPSTIGIGGYCRVVRR